MHEQLPSWVSEGSAHKYHSALNKLKTEAKEGGKEVTEEAVKAAYILRGGLLLASAETPEEPQEETPEAATTTPRRTRKAA